MEQKILRRISQTGRVPFMELRAHFPLANFTVAYQNLKRIKVIQEIPGEGESNVEITPEGREAIIKGFSDWMKEKVFNDVKNGDFILTKELTDLETSAARLLEQEGYIIKSGKFNYNALSKQLPLTQSSHEKILKSIEGSTQNRYAKIKYGEIISIVTALAIGILGILEPKYQYVSRVWEWLINFG